MEIAAKTLKQYENNPYFRQFGSSIDKVIQIVKQVKESVGTANNSFILFKKTPLLVGYEFLDPILNAVEHKQVLMVTYRTLQIILHLTSLSRLTLSRSGGTDGI